jgi:hypothetical protein
MTECVSLSNAFQHTSRENHWRRGCRNFEKKFCLHWLYNIVSQFTRSGRWLLSAVSCSNPFILDFNATHRQVTSSHNDQSGRRPISIRTNTTVDSCKWKTCPNTIPRALYHCQLSSFFTTRHTVGVTSYTSFGSAWGNRTYRNTSVISLSSQPYGSNTARCFRVACASDIMARMTYRPAVLPRGKTPRNTCHYVTYR